MWRYSMEIFWICFPGVSLKAYVCITWTEKVVSHGVEWSNKREEHALLSSFLFRRVFVINESRFLCKFTLEKHLNGLWVEWLHYKCPAGVACKVLINSTTIQMWNADKIWSIKWAHVRQKDRIYIRRMGVRRSL